MSTKPKFQPDDYVDGYQSVHSSVNVVSIHLALLIDSSRFLRMRILGSSDQKTTENKQKRRHKSNFFEFFRTCPNTSERHPNASGQVRTGPNGSKQVRTGPNTSENMKKRSGTPKKSEKIRKISRSGANFSDPALCINFFFRYVCP